MITKNHFLIFLFCILLFTCKSNEKKKQTHSVLTAYQISKIDSVCKSFIAKGNTVGFSIAIGHKGIPIFSKGYGYANKESKKLATDSTEYALASISKFITAVATLRMVEAGKLSLNDLVANYFDDFPNQEFMNEITVEHLLRHQSGIVDHEDWFDSIYINEKRVFKREEFHKFIDQPLFFRPGTNYSYSNSGYSILSHILEKISGQPYHEFIQEEIGSPLNSTSIGMWPSNWNRTNAAMGYELNESRIDTSFHMMTKGMKGDGGLSASVLDLIKLSKGLEDRTLISNESFDKLTSQTSIGDIKIDYGMGTRWGQYAGQKVYGHSGGYKGTGWSMLSHYPESGFTFAAAMNTNFSPEEIWMLRHLIMPIVLNVKPPKIQARSLGNIESYVGEYASLNRWNATSPPSTRVVTDKNGQLLWDNPETATPGTILYPLDKDVFTWEAYPFDTFKFHMVDGKAAAVSQYLDGSFINVRIRK